MRPVRYEDVQQKVKTAFGQPLDLHYMNNEVLSSAELCSLHGTITNCTHKRNLPLMQTIVDSLIRR